MPLHVLFPSLRTLWMAEIVNYSLRLQMSPSAIDTEPRLDVDTHMAGSAYLEPTSQSLGPRLPWQSHAWNLEKWHWWTYMQRRNADADIGNGRATQYRKERAGRITRVALTYTHYHVSNRQRVGSCRAAQGARLSAPWRPEGQDGGGWARVRLMREGYMYTYGWFML